MRRESGVKMAIKHYDRKLKWKVAKLNHEFQLPSYFKEFIGEKKKIRIADLGAGAISTTGTTWPGVEVEIVASDSLAEEYMELWKQQGYTPLVPIEKQDMEQLTYEDNSFDVVHCVNALDHTVNPLKAIREIQRICKPGGYVYLRHIENEGENESYAGFHQWNITTIGDDARFWSQDDSFILSHVEGWKTQIKTEEPNTPYEMEESVVITWQKPISQ